MIESNYQKKIKKKIASILGKDNCYILKCDEQQIQGFPDLIILGKEKWAALEVKKSVNAHRQPNQEYYVDKLNGLSFSRFIYPENEEEVLNDLQRAFGVGGKARDIGSEPVPLVKLQAITTKKKNKKKIRSNNRNSSS